MRFPSLPAFAKTTLRSGLRRGQCCLGLFAALFVCAGCDSSRAVVYKSITIDPITLVVDLHDPLPGTVDPQTDFYSPFSYADGHRSLEHFDTTTEHKPRIRYDFINLTANLRLASRQKNQVVLAGEFGTFYAESTFYYPTPPTASNTTTLFDVHAYSNEQESEPPQISDAAIPSDASLTVISVIRVLVIPTGYRLVAACYSPEGKLLNFSENNSTNGDCRLGGSIDFGYADKDVTPVGIPSKFPSEAYLAGHRDIFTPSTQISSIDCVTFHYNRNRLLRQDIHHSGQPLQSRTLRYKITPEDEALAAIDETHPFYQVKSE